jgi:hypothetical protein
MGLQTTLKLSDGVTYDIRANKDHIHLDVYHLKEDKYLGIAFNGLIHNTDYLVFKCRNGKAGIVI